MLFSPIIYPKYLTETYYYFKNLVRDAHTRSWTCILYVECLTLSVRRRTLGVRF